MSACPCNTGDGCDNHGCDKPLRAIPGQGVVTATGYDGGKTWPDSAGHRPRVPSVNGLSNRIDGLEGRLNAHRTILQTDCDRIDNLDVNLAELRKDLEEDLSSILRALEQGKAVVNGNAEATNHNAEALREAQVAINRLSTSIGMLNTGFDHQQKRIDRLEQVAVALAQGFNLELEFLPIQ